MFANFIDKIKSYFATRNTFSQRFLSNFISRIVSNYSRKTEMATFLEKQRDEILQIALHVMACGKNLQENETERLLSELLIRMLKTAYLVEILAVSGNFIEAITLMRSNYEKSLKVRYCLKFKKTNELKADLKRKNYSQKSPLSHIDYIQMAKKLGEDEKYYRFWSFISHPITLENLDIQKVDETKDTVSYLIFDALTEVSQEDIFPVLGSNNNILVATVLPIKDFILENHALQNYSSDGIPTAAEWNSNLTNRIELIKQKCALLRQMKSS